MRRFFYLSICFYLLLFCCGTAVAQDTIRFPWAARVGMRKAVPDGKVFRVADYGAVADGRTLASPAIQKAIDACAAAGGGKVVFEKGTYRTGAVFLKTGVHLYIGEGVELLGSSNFDDYPEIDTRIAGIEMKWPAALINVIGQHQVAVTGEGRINANGKFCWDKYWTMRKDYETRGLRWVVDYDAKRIRTILVQDCEDVLLKGLTIANAGFWTVQVLYARHVTVDGLVIRNNEDGHGPSTDGIDIDSSSWVLVQNCDIDCNDDDFCLKAGRDWDGLRVNRPTEYVVIRNCIARKGGGLLTIGSETSGGIRHVVATGLIAKGTGNGFHIKSAVTRGGVVEDIHFERAKLDSVKRAFYFLMNWNPAYSYSKLPEGYAADSIPEHWRTLLRQPEPAGKGIPAFRNIHIRDVAVSYAHTALVAEGLEQSPVQEVYFEKVAIRSGKSGSLEHTKAWDMTGINLVTQDEGFVLKRTEDTRLPKQKLQKKNRP